MSLLQIYEPGETPDPHHNAAAVGIDLGTTHSVIAIASEGKATVLHDMCGGVLVPSVVGYAAGNVRVGNNAVALMRSGHRDVISSIKRMMGKNTAEAKAAGFSHSITSPENELLRFAMAGKNLTAVEVSAEILRYLKQNAEAALGQDVTQAVITVPAYFDDNARQATRDAARLAGLEVLRLINEPTAAALAYGLNKNAQGIFAIYDLGGGTFDISILKLEDGVFQVLSTAGDTALGGDDFDAAIAGSGAWSAPRDQLLLAKARKVKEALSQTEEAVLVHEGQEHTVTRSRFEALILPLVEKTLRICQQALEDAGLEPAKIDGVVLVGGSTRVPLVRAKVEALFQKPPLTDIDPDEVVAVGAAIQAEGLTRGSDNLLLDVIPLSLGLETIGGITEKILHRNTPIPVAVSQEFTTYQDGQNGMIIHVVQGEREMVANNRSLARFELQGIPNLPAGIARVKITFSVDADGLLGVTAREETTAIQQSVTVKPSSGLAEQEIQTMLLESMQHARDDILKRLLREAEVEAKRSIEEIYSALKEDGDLLQPAETEALYRQIAVVETTLKEGDRNHIDQECEQLHRVSRGFAEKRMDRAIASALKGKTIATITESVAGEKHAYNDLCYP